MIGDSTRLLEGVETGEEREAYDAVLERRAAGDDGDGEEEEGRGGEEEIGEERGGKGMGTEER